MLGGHQAEVGHQLAGGLEAAEVANAGDEGDGRYRLQATKPPQRRHHRPHRPGRDKARNPSDQLIAPILGGIHTLGGPVIGALLGVLLSEATRIWLGTKGFSLLVYGLALVLCILFLPNGVWGGIRDGFARHARWLRGRS